MKGIGFIVLVLAVMAAGAVHSAPKPGFVTVTGSAVPGYSHADRGAPVSIQSLALKHSGALVGFCNVSQDGAIDPLLASGRDIAVYVYINQAEVQYYYDKGIRLFIFGNEPDGDWGTYGSILQMAYPMFQAGAPGSTVIGGNCFSLPPYEGLYQYHAFKDNCDLVGFHCYSDDPATGVSIGSIISLHNIMNTWGDGSKKILVGEGWGPKRELRSTPSVSPYVTPSLPEIEAMRDFVVNGWRNLTTSAGGYDPNWVDTALFFTLSDNWGFDYAHFYNGGLIDLYGNPKDDLLLLFPGDRLTLANCGFEHYKLGVPDGPAPFWEKRGGTSDDGYAIDASVRKAGLRSQRVEVSGTTEAYVNQTTNAGSISAGQQYTFAAWVKTQDVAGDDGVRVRIRFYNSGGSSLGDTYSSALQGTNDWTRLTVTATAPATAVKARVDCNVQGTTGRAWFDDCSISNAATPQQGGIEGYVLKPDNTVIASATVSAQPGGATTTSDSTGKFTLSNLDAGVYNLTAEKTGYSGKTVTRVVVAPDRTSVAGLQMQTLATGAPANVEVSSAGVSGVLKISWSEPATGADYYRVYRSTTSGALGTREFDNVTPLCVHDEGLADFQTYYYTVRAVTGSTESTNTDQYPGVPTGGATLPIYDTAADPDWGNNASVHGQTFTTPKSGSIISATCVLANSASPNYRTVTFSVHETGPGGAQIGPSKPVTCYFNEIGTAQWTSNQVPVVEGQTYYLRLGLNSSASMYRTKSDVVAGGRYYMNDSPYLADVDMWSTISLAENCAPDILNVEAEVVGDGRVKVSWETTAPATSQVEYGATASYGSSSTHDPGMTAGHEVELADLAPGDYHFRVKSTRSGLPDACSLDYTFSVPDYPTYDLTQAKELPDGSFVRIPDLIVSADTDDFADSIAVLRPDRIGGIRVYPLSPTTLSRGDSVVVQGKMDTVDGERRIINAVVEPT